MISTGAIIFLTREGEEATMLSPLGVSCYLTHLASSLRYSGIDHFLVACHAEDEPAAKQAMTGEVVFATTGTADGDKKLAGFLERFERVCVFTAPVYLTDGICALLTDESPLPHGERPYRSIGVFRADAKALHERISSGIEITTALGAIGECLHYQGERETHPVSLRDRLSYPHPHEALARENLLARYSAGGVRVLCPENTFFDPRVTIGDKTTVLPGCILRGETQIGTGCELGPNTMITDCVVGDGTVMNQSQAVESHIGAGCNIGPFAYIRPNCRLADKVKVGDFVELKNSTIGTSSKVPHLTYVGDSDVGSGCNFGCGTITVNYDGVVKERCTIEDNVFVGCNTNLVAPVRVGTGAYIAAGSTITVNVPAGSLAIARTRQENKRDWVKKKRK